MQNAGMLEDVDESLDLDNMPQSQALDFKAELTESGLLSAYVK